MRPTPIPEEDVVEGTKRLILWPPLGHPELDGDVRPIEMLAFPSDLDGRETVAFVARFVLDDGDLERLAAGEPIYVTMMGHVVPFDVALAETAG